MIEAEVAAARKTLELEKQIGTYEIKQNILPSDFLLHFITFRFFSLLFFLSFSFLFTSSTHDRHLQP